MFLILLWVWWDDCGACNDALLPRQIMAHCYSTAGDLVWCIAALYFVETSENKRSTESIRQKAEIRNKVVHKWAVS